MLTQRSRLLFAIDRPPAVASIQRVRPHAPQLAASHLAAEFGVVTSRTVDLDDHVPAEPASLSELLLPIEVDRFPLAVGGEAQPQRSCRHQLVLPVEVLKNTRPYRSGEGPARRRLRACLGDLRDRGLRAPGPRWRAPRRLTRPVPSTSAFWRPGRAASPSARTPRHDCDHHVDRARAMRAHRLRIVSDRP